MNSFKKFGPVLLIFSLIALAGFAGYNSPLFNWPLIFDGSTLEVDSSITLKAENIIVASLTSSTSSGTYVTDAELASLTFGGLSDVGTRTGNAGKVFTVNASETGYTYSTPGGGGGILNPASTGANIFTGDQEINGNASISLTLRLRSGLMEYGTTDSYGRYQIWNHAPNAVLRLGSLEQDGDPGPQTPSEGIVVYGPNSNATFTNLDWAYARIKPNRFGLLDTINNVQTYIFRVDSTELYTKDNSGNKTFNVTRSTGNTTCLGVATFSQVFASSSTVSLGNQLTTKDYVDSVAGGGSLTRETVTTGVSTSTITFTLPLKSENDTILTMNGIVLDPADDYDFISSYVASIAIIVPAGTKFHTIH